MEPSAKTLESYDRCRRAPFYAREWEKESLRPVEILRRAVEFGLTSEDADPAQAAGDEAMTIASERNIDTKETDLYNLAMHICSLADIITWVLRAQNPPWERPQAIIDDEVLWQPSCFIEPSGTRLRQVLIVDYWSPEREVAAAHSWETFGNQAFYNLPMLQTVVSIGQMRQGRWHSPWSKAWQHPRSKQIKMKKRNGAAFDGNWKPVFREETEYSREHWLDIMTEDGVLTEVLKLHEEPVLDGAAMSKIRRLSQDNLIKIAAVTEAPPPQPSVCDDAMRPCQFRAACWSFQPPSVKLGFIRR